MVNRALVMTFVHQNFNEHFPCSPTWILKCTFESSEEPNFLLVISCQTTNFRFFPLKEFAVDNFKFDGNGRQFSKRGENTVRKGEIACYEQFLLFLQCFLKTCTVDT